MVLINTYCPVNTVANEVSKNTINENKQEHKPTDTEANCMDWIIDCPHGCGLSNGRNQTICLVSFLTLYQTNVHAIMHMGTTTSHETMSKICEDTLEQHAYRGFEKHM